MLVLISAGVAVNPSLIQTVVRSRMSGSVVALSTGVEYRSDRSPERILATVNRALDGSSPLSDKEPKDGE